MESLRYCKVLAHTGSHHGPTVSGSHWQVTTRNWIFDLSFLQSQLHLAAWEHNITVGCYSLDIFHQNTCTECFLLTLMQPATWPLQEACKHKAVILCVLEIGTVRCDKSVRKQINRWMLCVTSHSKKWDNHTESSRVKICLEETVTADTLWIFLSPTLCTSSRLQDSWHIKCDTFAPSCKTGICHCTQWPINAKIKSSHN